MIYEGGLRVAAALCKEFEGCSLTPYLCPTGHWTIGYGCTIDAHGDKVTGATPPLKSEAEAEALMMAVLRPVAMLVDKMLDRKVKLSDNEAGALYSLAFNIGTGNLRTSTLMRLLNTGEARTDVANQFLVWNKGRVNGALVTLPGHVRRRQAERSKFLTK